MASVKNYQLSPSYRILKGDKVIIEPTNRLALINQYLGLNESKGSIGSKLKCKFWESFWNKRRWYDWTCKISIDWEFGTSVHLHGYYMKSPVHISKIIVLRWGFIPISLIASSKVLVSTIPQMR